MHSENHFYLKVENVLFFIFCLKFQTNLLQCTDYICFHRNRLRKEKAVIRLNHSFDTGLG